MKDKLVKQDIGMIEDIFELVKNLVSIESHSLNSYISTKDEKWLELMQIVRKKRTRYLSLITKDVGGQGWCIFKHLSESIMRLQECATRFLSTNQLEEAKICSEDAGDLHKLFLILNDYGGKNVREEVKSSA